MVNLVAEAGFVRIETKTHGQPTHMGDTASGFSLLLGLSHFPLFSASRSIHSNKLLNVDESEHSGIMAP